jgi:hypothetical protein
MSETRMYFFVDDDGRIADQEEMAPTEAQLRNAYAAPGQALRWKSQNECTCDVLIGCIDRLRRLRSRPVRLPPQAH